MDSKGTEGQGGNSKTVNVKNPKIWDMVIKIFIDPNWKGETINEMDNEGKQRVEDKSKKEIEDEGQLKMTTWYYYFHILSKIWTTRPSCNKTTPRCIVEHKNMCSH